MIIEVTIVLIALSSLMLLIDSSSIKILINTKHIVLYSSGNCLNVIISIGLEEVESQFGPAPEPVYNRLESRYTHSISINSNQADNYVSLHFCSSHCAALSW